MKHSSKIVVCVSLCLMTMIPACDDDGTIGGSSSDMGGADSDAGFDTSDAAADGGEDTIENAVALCPNCHRMMHSLRRKSDIDLLILANKARNK